MLPAVRAVEQDVVALDPEALDGMGRRILQIGQIKLPVLDVVHPQNGNACAAIAQGQVGSVFGPDNEAPQVCDSPCRGARSNFRLRKRGLLSWRTVARQTTREHVVDGADVDDPQLLDHRVGLKNRLVDRVENIRDQFLHA
jgi:hypothetical protein